MFVSVITPTYNREKFLPEAIDSVLAQSHENWELLIVDDGSTDNSQEIIKEYTAKDSRIRYFHQNNQGQSIARNLALKEAKGDCICFLDSDNYWPQEKLLEQIAALEASPETDIIYGDTITINEEGEEVSRKNMRRYSGRISAKLLKDNFVSMNTTMTRAKCFEKMGGMSGKRKVADDYDLWLRFSSQFRFLYVPEFWVYYRVMEDQISSNKNRRFDANEEIIRDFVSQFPDAITNEERLDGLASFYCRKARYFATNSDRAKAFKALAKAFGYRPLSVNNWRALYRTVTPNKNVR